MKEGFFRNLRTLLKRDIMKKYMFTLLLVLAGTLLKGQDIIGQPEVVTEANYVEDTKTIETTIEALLNTMSGPPNQDRDWFRFINLFTDKADIAVVMKNEKTGQREAISVPLIDFVKQNGPIYRARGFNQVEIGKKIHEWNGIATAIQAYEWGVANNDFKVRGVNHIQLIYSNNRWYITNLIFTSESDESPIPAQYLARN